MLQHDIELHERGRSMIHSLKKLLAADIVFTELETALSEDEEKSKAQCLQQTTSTSSTTTSTTTTTSTSTTVTSCTSTTTSVVTRPASSVFWHCASPKVLDVLSKLGFNIVEGANNHAADCGFEGIDCLIRHLHARKMSFAGVGYNLQQAAAVSYVNTQPHTSSCSVSYRVAHVAFASKVPAGSEATDTRPGVNSLSMIDPVNYILHPEEAERVLCSLSEARENADVVIAYHHCHYLSNPVNIPGELGYWKIEFARACIDAGATMYVGHGDPRLQGIEIYRGYPIFHCLGSLIFQTKTKLGFYGQEVWESVIVQIQYHANHQFHSHNIDTAVVTPDTLLDENSTGSNNSNSNRSRRCGSASSSASTPTSSSLSPHHRNGVSSSHEHTITCPIQLANGLRHSASQSCLATTAEPLPPLSSPSPEPAALADGARVVPFSSFSIKLFPVVLNECGDAGAHHQTRGLPVPAPPDRARGILSRLQAMSAKFGTIIQVDDSEPDNVVGWVLDGQGQGAPVFPPPPVASALPSAFSLSAAAAASSTKTLVLDPLSLSLSSSLHSHSVSTALPPLPRPIST